MSVGGQVGEAHPTLCVYADDLEPEDITRLLGCSASRSHRKGDLLGPPGIAARTGAWLLEWAGKTSGDLEAQIREILAKVTTDEKAWRQVAERCTIRMNCMLTLREWSRGLSLSPDLLGNLAKRGIELGISIYFVGDEDA